MLASSAIKDAASADVAVQKNVFIGPNKFIPRPHLGGHASCIRAGLTPTFPPLWGLEVGAHSLMHAEF